METTTMITVIFCYQKGQYDLFNLKGHLFWTDRNKPRFLLFFFFRCALGQSPVLLLDLCPRPHSLVCPGVCSLLQCLERWTPLYNRMRLG